ncbi:hypothetical protein Jiend_43410 [Micromonospora endophytica]|nr:DUF5753 domain-containing protein [Micromonospora endophytica]BCJ60919.1 hypothetical protein Jiend_43410 [Micromonospora endophytica]
MLNRYGASAEDTDLLLAMTAATRENKNWWHDYIDSGLPRWTQLYIGLEEAAASIRQYHPGLLQTKTYAEQLFQMPGVAMGGRAAAVLFGLVLLVAGCTGTAPAGRT